MKQPDTSHGNSTTISSNRNTSYDKRKIFSHTLKTNNSLSFNNSEQSKEKSFKKENVLSSQFNNTISNNPFDENNIKKIVEKDLLIDSVECLSALNTKAKEGHLDDNSKIKKSVMKPNSNNKTQQEAKETSSTVAVAAAEKKESTSSMNLKLPLNISNDIFVEPKNEVINIQANQNLLNPSNINDIMNLLSSNNKDEQEKLIQKKLSPSNTTNIKAVYTQFPQELNTKEAKDNVCNEKSNNNNNNSSNNKLLENNKDKKSSNEQTANKNAKSEDKKTSSPKDLAKKKLFIQHNNSGLMEMAKSASNNLIPEDSSAKKLGITGLNNNTNNNCFDEKNNVYYKTKDSETYRNKAINSIENQKAHLNQNFSPLKQTKPLNSLSKEHSASKIKSMKSDLAKHSFNNTNENFTQKSKNIFKNKTVKANTYKSQDIFIEDGTNLIKIKENSDKLLFVNSPSTSSTNVAHDSLYNLISNVNIDNIAKNAQINSNNNNSNSNKNNSDYLLISKYSDFKMMIEYVIENNSKVAAASSSINNTFKNENQRDCYAKIIAKLNECVEIFSKENLPLN